jgi:hypothetical protein
MHTRKLPRSAFIANFNGIRRDPIVGYLVLLDFTLDFLSRRFKMMLAILQRCSRFPK